MKAKFGKNRVFWRKIAKNLALKYSVTTKLENKLLWHFTSKFITPKSAK